VSVCGSVVYACVIALSMSDATLLAMKGRARQISQLHSIAQPTPKPLHDPTQNNPHEQAPFDLILSPLDPTCAFEACSELHTQTYLHNHVFFTCTHTQSQTTHNTKETDAVLRQPT